MPRVVTVSAGQSQISTDKTVIAADGVEVCTVYVTVNQDRNNANGQALPTQRYAASNVTISVTPSTGVVITQPTGTADASGTVTATFTSTNAASVAIGATAFGRTLVSGGAVTVVGGAGPVDPPTGDPFYAMGTTEATARANDNGFTWSTGNTRMSVAEVPAGRTGWGLRFRYGPDANGADSSAEQRFAFGRSVSHLWLDFDVHIPSNFAHRTQATAINNKFLSFWRDSYGAAGQTWMVGYEYETSAGVTPDSNIRVVSNRWDFAFWSSATNGGYNVTGQGARFIANSGAVLVRGAWNNVRMELKAASNSTATDGIQRMWINGVLHSEITNAKFWNPNSAEPDTVLKNGYFWGWANSGFAEETLVHIHGAKFYDTDPEWT